MISSLMAAGAPRGGNVDSAIPVQMQQENPRYSRALSCQIWSLNGTLIGRSAGAPQAPMAIVPEGFSERVVEGNRWRVFTHLDRARNLRVLVGDNMSVRRNLVRNLIAGLFLPALLALAALGLLIWGGLGRGLAPLRAMAAALQRRSHEDLEPLSINPSTELAPVAESIDDLLLRLRHARERERHFIASAAHELQTPLAGLRTHAQIAVRSLDEQVRSKALERILGSVDRTSRLVAQLLDLARQESFPLPEPRWIAPVAVIAMVCEELRALAGQRGIVVDVDDALAQHQICIDDTGLFLSVRNLLENALNHTPANTTVAIGLQRQGPDAGIVISDSGSGIHPAELDAVRGRFVRGSGETGAGSGLGLSIVELALARSEARLLLENRPGTGLRAIIAVGEDRVRAIERV